MLFWKNPQPEQPSAENKTENATRPFGLIEQLRIDELLENASFNSDIRDIAKNENDLSLLESYFSHLKKENLEKIESQIEKPADVDFIILDKEDARLARRWASMTENERESERLFNEIFTDAEKLLGKPLCIDTTFPRKKEK